MPPGGKKAVSDARAKYSKSEQKKKLDAETPKIGNATEIAKSTTKTSDTISRVAKLEQLSDMSAFSAFTNAQFDKNKVIKTTEIFAENNTEEYPSFLAGDLSNDVTNTDSTIKSIIVKRPTLKNILDNNGKWKELNLPQITYRVVDFIYCKWYGIIPNNYMITLTRSNLPVNDEGLYSLSGPAVEVREKDIKSGAFSAKVVAQAVTYLGKKTGNSLSTILGFNGNMRWGTPEEAKDTYINSNAIGGSLKLSDFGLGEAAQQITQILTTGIKGSNLASGVSAAFKGLGQGLSKAAGSGYITYKILRAFAKQYKNGEGEAEKGDIAPRDALTIAQQQFDPYEPGKNGIFARKSFGGVNKIITTQKRIQGIDFSHEIKLKFQYSLKNLAYSQRGKGTINSKVAMLDIIGNLMGLVMSNAEFYGGANKYRPSSYQFDFSTDIKELMLTATSTEILRELKKKIGTIKDSMLSDIKGVVDNFVEILGSSNVEELNKADKKSDDYENIFRLLFYEFFKGQSAKAGSTEASAFNLINMQPEQTPALLTGMNVGEWHVIIGNPFNPIARIGNLICTNYAFNFPSDQLGPDDFPTELEFTITLKPGRPRDRRGVTNMFGFIHKDKAGSTSTILERTSATRDSDIDDAPSKINLQEALRRSYFRPGEKVGPRRNIIGANTLQQNILEGGGLGAPDFLSPGARIIDPNITSTTNGIARRFDNVSAINAIIETNPVDADSYQDKSAQLDVDFKRKEIEEGYKSEAGSEVGRFPNALLRLNKELGANSNSNSGKLPSNLFNNF